MFFMSLLWLVNKPVIENRQDYRNIAKPYFCHMLLWLYSIGS